jgi:hypothetical protein
LEDFVFVGIGVDGIAVEVQNYSRVLDSGLRLLPVSDGVLQSSFTFWNRLSRGSAIGALAANCAAVGATKEGSAIASASVLIDFVSKDDNRPDIIFPQIWNAFEVYNRFLRG